MSAIIDYIIIPEKKLIIEHLSGNITPKDLITFKERLIRDKHYHSSFNLIEDLRDARFNLNKEDVKCYIDYLLNDKRHFGKRNTAFITTNPNQVVISTFFEALKENLPINTLISSTLELATTHVNIGAKDFSLVQDCLNNLKEKSKFQKDRTLSLKLA